MVCRDVAHRLLSETDLTKPPGPGHAPASPLFTCSGRDSRDPGNEPPPLAPLAR